MSVYEVSRKESKGQEANRMPPNAYHQEIGVPGHGTEKGKESLATLIRILRVTTFYVPFPATVVSTGLQIIMIYGNLNMKTLIATQSVCT